MAQNKMEDLRNHLFAQLERLNDESLSQEELKLEINRAKGIAELTNVIVFSAKVEVDFLKLKSSSVDSSTNSQLFKSIEKP